MSISSFSVICLCADWCDTCRNYRPGFERISVLFPDTIFVWLDIEDIADALGNTDIESFPTLIINRGELVLYYGVMLPYPKHLARVFESFRAQDDEESRRYVKSDAQRRHWQDDQDLKGLLDRCTNK